MAELVLFAGDLAGGDLVEQALGALGELERRQRCVLAELDDLLDVGEELVGVLVHALGVARHPELLLDAVPAGEVDALGDRVGLAAVGDRVEVTELLGNGLDALPVGAGDREELLGLVDLAGLDGGDELLGLDDQRVGLRLRRSARSCRQRP